MPRGVRVRVSPPVLLSSNDFKKVIRAFLINRGVEFAPIAIGTLPLLLSSNDFKKVIRAFLINRGVEFVPIAIGTPPVLKEKLLLIEELFFMLKTQKMNTE